MAYCCRCRHALEDHDADDPAMSCQVCACPALVCRCGHGFDSHTEELPMACTVCRCDRFRLNEDDADAFDDEEELVSWVKVDDGMADHPKYDRFGADRAVALGLQLAVLCYCAKYLTDGRLTEERVAAIGAGLKLEPAVLDRIVGGLLAAGVWQHHDDGGFMVHDYLVYNPSRDSELEKRRKDAARKAAGRHQQASERSPSGLQTDSERESARNPAVPSRPVPSSTETDSKAERRRPRLPALPPVSPDGEPPLTAWGSYAAAYQRRYGVQPVRNAKTSAVLGKLADRIPADEVPAVVAFFVAHDGPLYVRSGHAVELLLRDAEKLRTEWVTGRTIATGPPSKTAGNVEALRRFVERGESGA